MGTGGYQLCPQDFTLEIQRDERKLMDVRHGHQSRLTALGRVVLPGQWGRVMGQSRHCQEWEWGRVEGEHFLCSISFLSPNPGQIMAAHQVKGFGRKEKLI